MSFAPACNASVTARFQHFLRGMIKRHGVFYCAALGKRWGDGPPGFQRAPGGGGEKKGVDGETKSGIGL